MWEARWAVQRISMTKRSFSQCRRKVGVRIKKMQFFNNFKQINDTYGHQAGDEVLKAVAKRLRNHQKKSDFAARLGGDEFVVIKHDDSHHGDIEHCVAAMKASLHEDVEYEQQSIPIKVAMGYASYPQDGLDFDQLLRQADRRMYHQKQAMNQDT